MPYNINFGSWNVIVSIWIIWKNFVVDKFLDENLTKFQHKPGVKINKLIVS